MRTRSFQAQTAATLAAFALTGCVSPAGADLGSDDSAITSKGFARVASAADGLPYFVRGTLGRATGPVRDLAQARSALAAALPAIAAPFKVRASDLVATRVQHDRVGMTHVRFAQHKNGLRVVGGELVVHVAADGAIRSVTSSARDGVTLTATPSIAASKAADTARLSTAAGKSTVSAPELTYVIASGSRKLHLAWETYATGTEQLVVDRVYVDALSGAIVARHPQVHTARNRLIRDGLNKTFPLALLNAPTLGTEARGPATDEIAIAAFDNTGATYDCYAELFDRDSYDDAGAQLKSLVHVLFSTPDGGTSGNNAAWVNTGPPLNIATMVYGDGDGEFMGPTPLGFDVTAHELTHAVTSSTANLTYSGESGALNEAWSDIMAAVCEVRRDGGTVSANTWLVGEDIFTPGTPGDALRYMNDPTADSDLYPPELGGSRDFYPDRYAGTEDNGGVHLNSGIANLAFQLAVDGGTHPQDKTTFEVPGIGMEKAAAIFQRALTQGYLTADSTFAEARTATEEVADELYGAAEVAAVSLAWAAVGVGEPPVVDLPPTVSITSPANNATVAPGFTVNVTADDDVAVVRVELLVDGAVVGTDTSEPYSFVTNAALADGSHTVEAVAHDATSDASASITVTVADPGGGDDGNPGDDDGGGGCSTSGSSGAAGSMLLMVGLALAVRRRSR